MPDPVSITCPHCSAKLKLKDRSKLGQKLGCPKCKKPFKAQEDVQEEDEFAGLIGSEDEEEEAPPVRRAATAARGKARGKSSSSKLPLILGGVVGLLLLVGVGLAVSHFLGGKEKPADPVAGPEAGGPPQGQPPSQPPAPKSIDFAWLPSQSEMVVFIRPHDILASEFAQWAIDAAGGRAQFQKGQEKMRQEVGVTFDDVESITIGIKSLGDLAAGAAQLAPGGMPNPMAAMNGLSQLKDKEIVGVIRLRSPLDLTKNAEFMQKSDTVTHGSVTYLREKGGNQPSALYAASPTMIVFCGREDVLKGLLDRQGKPEPRPELEILDPADQLALGFVLGQNVIPEEAAAAGSPFAAFSKIKSACIGLKATAGLELSVRQACPDSTTAQDVQTATEGLVAMGKEKLSSLSGSIPPNLDQLANTLLTNVKTSRRDNVIETRADLPMSARESLQAAPGELMMAILMGGLGGRGNGGPGAIDFSGGFSNSNDSDTMGETVVVEKLSGLPEGVTLKGRAGWSNAEMFEQDGKTPLPRTLAVQIDYLGGLAAKGVEFGNLQVSRLVVEPDQHLKVTEAPGTFGEIGPYKGYAGIKRNEFLSKHPEDGVRVELDFERPLTLPTKIAVVEGTVVLKYAEQTKDIVVPKLIDQAGKVPGDSDLKAAGFHVELKTEGTEKNLTMIFGPGAKVADLKLVGPDGNPLEDAPYVMRLDYGGIVRYGCTVPVSGSPGTMGAKVTLHTVIREVTLPFRLENLTVPPPPDPAVTPSSPWRLASGKSKVPPGLFVQGRLKWENTSSFDNKPPSPEIHLTVDVTGPQAFVVVGAGFQKIDAAETDVKRSLNPKPAGLPSGGDRSKQFSKVMGNPLLSRQPPDGVQVAFGFEPSPISFSKVTYVAGSFKLLVAKERKKTVLDKLPSRIGKSATTPELRAAGIELKLAKDEFGGMTMKLAKGNPWAVGDALLVRESTEGELDFPNMMFDPAEKSGSLYLGDNKLKANDALEITYYTGVEELEFSFEFEDLVVPPLPKAEN